MALIKNVFGGPKNWPETKLLVYLKFNIFEMLSVQFLIFKGGFRLFLSVNMMILYA